MEEAFGLCLGVIGFFVHVTITWAYKEFCLFNSWHQFSPLSTGECKKELIISSLQHPVLLMALLQTIVTQFYTCMWNILIRHLSTISASLHTFQSLILLLTKFPLHYHIFWICFRHFFVSQCLARPTHARMVVELFIGPWINHPWLYHWGKWFSLLQRLFPVVTVLGPLSHLWLNHVRSGSVLRTETVVGSWNPWARRAQKAAFMTCLPVVWLFPRCSLSLGRSDRNGLLRTDYSPSLILSTLTCWAPLHWPPISTMRWFWSLPRTTVVYQYKRTFRKQYDWMSI